MENYNLEVTTDKKIYGVNDDIIYTAKLTFKGVPLEGEEIQLTDADSAVKTVVSTDSNGEAIFISSSNSPWGKAKYTRTVMYGIKAKTEFEVR